jgi:hypothetical protein
VTLVQADPTWALEYEHFKRRCRTGEGGNLANDLVLDPILADLARAALGAG